MRSSEYETEDETEDYSREDCELIKGELFAKFVKRNWRKIVINTRWSHFSFKGFILRRVWFSRVQLMLIDEVESYGLLWNWGFYDLLENIFSQIFRIKIFWRADPFELRNKNFERQI